MALPDSGTGGVWMRYVPHVLMALVQLCYTLLYFVAEAAFNRGLNTHVYVTYRHLFVAVLLSPFAYYYEKNLRPKMTFMLFLEIFVLSLLGVSLTLNMYFVSLKYTSPAFLSSVVNSLATITFVIAIVLRMEIVDMKSLRGVAKVAGTVVSFAGVTTITLYKGTAIASLWRAPIHIHGSNAVQVHESWMKGSFLAVASCICWSFWYILQGITCNGLAVFLQLWCNKKKGPVFVSMFGPLSTIMVAILAYFIFGENLYVGSIIGGVVVIVGLYMLLWGKDKDHEQKTSKGHEVELDCENQAR
ncbi:hypothetical protein EJB05_08000, partial [Eragrostis curvula]